MRYSSYRSYHRSGRRSRAKSEALAHIQAGRELATKYGPAYQHIRAIFFSLDESRRYQLFNLYRDRFGSSAAEYAQQTYRRWQSGQVQMSGQTGGRLLDLLPQVMGPEEKLTLVELVRNQAIQSQRRTQINLTIKSQTGVWSAVDQALSLADQAAKFEVPEWYSEVRAWLGGPEGQTFNQIAREAEARIGLAKAADVAVQVALLFRLQNSLPFRASVTARFALHTSDITINVLRDENDLMNGPYNDDDLLARLETEAIRHQRLGGQVNFVDYVLRTLSPEEAQVARQMAIKKGVELELLLHEIHARSKGADQAIAQTIQTANELKQGGHRGTISQEITTSAGSMKIEIHTDRSQKSSVLIAVGVGVATVGALGILWFLYSVGIIGRH